MKLPQYPRLTKLLLGLATALSAPAQTIVAVEHAALAAAVTPRTQVSLMTGARHVNELPAAFTTTKLKGIVIAETTPPPSATIALSSRSWEQKPLTDARILPDQSFADSSGVVQILVDAVQIPEVLLSGRGLNHFSELPRIKNGF